MKRVGYSGGVGFFEGARCNGVDGVYWGGVGVVTHTKTCRLNTCEDVIRHVSM